MPNFRLPSLRATKMYRAAVATFEPTSATPRKPALTRIREARGWDADAASCVTPGGVVVVLMPAGLRVPA